MRAIMRDKNLGVLCFVLLVALTGCDGDSGGGGPAAHDLNGTFQTQGVSCATSTGEPLPTPTRRFKMTQVEMNLTAVDEFFNIVYDGSVSGSEVRLRANYMFQGLSCTDAVAGTAFDPNGGTFTLNTTCSDGSSGSCTGQLQRV